MYDDRIVKSLTEDFAKIGFGGTAKQLHRLSTTRLDESIFDVPFVGSESSGSVSADPIDGPVATMELFNRIASLDFTSLSESDVSDILNGLREKELPEGDAELAEAAEAVVKALIEHRSSLNERAGGIIFKGLDSKKHFRAQKGRHTDPETGKTRVLTGGEKSDARQAYRKGKSKKRAWTKRNSKRMARMAMRRDNKGLETVHQKATLRRMNQEGLVSDLHSLLGESRSDKFGEYADTVERIARVSALIEQILGEQVGDVLENAYTGMENSLLTESEDATAAFSPVLKVIARCLEEIDSMGNG
jgi:hypothetical protein